MPAWSEAARVDAPAPRPRQRPKPPQRPSARRPRRRRGVAGGVVSIALVSLLLAGVVAMNVAVLRLNIRLDKLGEERARLRADNAELASQISAAAASPRIQQLARKRLGLVPADPQLTTYVNLAR